MTCNKCFGKGWVTQKPGWESYPKYGYWYSRQVACTTCNGTGDNPGGPVGMDGLSLAGHKRYRHREGA